MHMKHNFTNRLFILLAILLVGTANAFANSNKNYYSKANAYATPSAAGKVYVAYNRNATNKDKQSATNSTKIRTY